MINTGKLLNHLALQPFGSLQGLDPFRRGKVVESSPADAIANESLGYVFSSQQNWAV